MDIPDEKLNDKVNLEWGIQYGPREIEPKYDFGDKYSDNLKLKRQELSFEIPKDPVDVSREIVLSEQYRQARDDRNTLFLHVDGGIDFSKVPDYEPLFSQYMQSQTPGDAPLSKNQEKIHTAAFMVALYDELDARREQDGAYDPHLYLGVEDFCRRLTKGDIKDVEAESIAYAIGELNNYSNGKRIADEVAKSSLAIKLLSGYGFKFGEAAESIANLPSTLSGKILPTSPSVTAYERVGKTLDEGEKIAYILSGTLGQMTPYILAGAGGGSVVGYTTMFAQGLGSSMSGALREGQNYLDSLGYGVTSATMEMALNKLLGATGGVLGKSALGKTTSSLLQKGFTSYRP